MNNNHASINKKGKFKELPNSGNSYRVIKTTQICNTDEISTHFYQKIVFFLFGKIARFFHSLPV
jgi:hypothetical protein